MRTIVHGDFAYSKKITEMSTLKGSYMIVEDGTIVGFSTEKPEMRESDCFLEFERKLIIPGFADMHLHAPQFPNVGLGTDMELLEWLKRYTFPEEAKYVEVDYAEKVYKKLINKLWSVGSLYSCIFGSIHEKASTRLFELLIDSGLYSFVGKVNMDRNSPDFYVETTDESIRETKHFIENNYKKSERVKPIITPRFVPTCTAKLMKGLGELAEEYNIPVQSHLDENQAEIQWVCSLHPDSNSYAHVYERFKLFGSQPTLMGHCIYCNDEELELLLNSDVMAIHCPFSNANLISGIMPVKRYLDLGVKVALGSDISGGNEINIAKVMVLSMQLSKMLAVHNATPGDYLSTQEAFYLGTKAGGAFFGKHGSLEPGYEADFLVIDDSDYLINELSVQERVEKFLYVGKEENIRARYVSGKKIEKPFDV
ncbi:amidohydrolase family protein [Clostridia bacterium]|nr:amidohydrolase family protein [Clostridia bacterium]